MIDSRPGEEKDQQHDNDETFTLRCTRRELPSGIRVPSRRIGRFVKKIVLTADCRNARDACLFVDGVTSISTSAGCIREADSPERAPDKRIVPGPRLRVQDVSSREFVFARHAWATRIDGDGDGHDDNDNDTTMTTARGGRRARDFATALKKSPGDPEERGRRGLSWRDTHR